MIPIVYWSRLLAFSALAAVIWPSALRGQRVIEVPQNRPAFTLAQAEAALKEVAPLVERACERRFREIPRLKLITRNELIALEAATARKGADPALVARFRNRDPKLVQQLSLWTVGIYDSKTVYFIPTNMNLSFSQSTIPFDKRIAYLRHWVAHELVHAIQDQEIGKDGFFHGVSSDEEGMARQALIEGHAEFVTDEVDRLLGDPIGSKERAAFLDAKRSRAGNLPQSEAILSTKLSTYYLAGRQFVAHFYEQGGMNQVWKLFEAPPSDMGMIHEPDRYSPVRRTVRNYSGVFDGLAVRLGLSPERVINFQVGPWSLETKEFWNMTLKSDEKQALIDRVVTCAHWQAKSPDASRTCYLNVYELKGDESYAVVPQVINNVWARAGYRTLPRLQAEPSTAKTGAENEAPPALAISSAGAGAWTASAHQGHHFLTFYGSYAGMTRESLAALLQDILGRL